MVCFVYLTMKWLTVFANKPHDSYAKMSTICQAELFNNILLSLSAPIYKRGIIKTNKQTDKLAQEDASKWEQR